MKKFLSLVLALIMTMSLVTISAGATEYKDLTDKDEIQYEEAVAVLNRIGIITGYDDGSFQPTKELTRGAAAKIIVSLLIGPEAASALPNNTAPYPDVPAGSTFAGVISFCKTREIISGYGDGTFKPTNSLTGYAFSKMLLGAVGYDSKVEGFTGTGWTMNVASIGNYANLFNRIEFDGSAAVNREQACQLALNTLKATMVEYNGGVNINTASGDTMTVNPTRTYKISNQEYAKNISNRKASDKGNVTGDTHWTVEFGEEHFKDLRLDNEHQGKLDDFGRPSNVWSYKKVTIGTFPVEPDFTYTTQVAAKDDPKISDATKLRALGLNGFEVDSKTELRVNGLSEFPFNAKDNNVYDIANYTDNGTLVEVYVSDDDADYICNVAVIQTQLMEVKKIGSDYVSLNKEDDCDDKKAGFNREPIQEVVDDVEVEDVCYDFLKDLKAEDKVAVVPLTTDGGKTYTVAKAYAPETVTGTLDGSKTFAVTGVEDKDRSVVQVTVGGTDYKVANWNKDLNDANRDIIKVTKNDVTLLLDEYGNAMLAKDIGSTTEVMVLGAWRNAVVNGVLVRLATGWDMKGNAVSLNVGAEQSSVVKNTYKNYEPGDVLRYTNDGVTGIAEWSLNENGIYRAPGNDKVDSDGYAIKASNSAVKLGDAAKPYPAGLDDVVMKASGVKTVYVAFDGDEVDYIEIKSGLQNTTKKELDQPNPGNTNAAQGVVKLQDGGVGPKSEVEYVVIKQESSDATLKNLGYVYDVDTTNKRDENGDIISDYKVFTNEDEAVRMLSAKNIGNQRFVRFNELNAETKLYDMRTYDRRQTGTSVMRATILGIAAQKNNTLLSLDPDSYASMANQKLDDANTDPDLKYPNIQKNINGFGTDLTVGDKVANLISIKGAKFLDLTNNKISDADDLEAILKGDADKGIAPRDVKVHIAFNDNPDNDEFRLAYIVVVVDVIKDKGQVGAVSPSIDGGFEALASAEVGKTYTVTLNDGFSYNASANVNVSDVTVTGKTVSFKVTGLPATIGVSKDAETKTLTITGALASATDLYVFAGEEVLTGESKVTAADGKVMVYKVVPGTKVTIRSSLINAAPGDYIMTDANNTTVTITGAGVAVIDTLDLDAVVSGLQKIDDGNGNPIDTRTFTITVDEGIEITKFMQADGTDVTNDVRQEGTTYYVPASITLNKINVKTTDTEYAFAAGSATPTMADGTNVTNGVANQGTAMEISLDSTGGGISKNVHIYGATKITADQVDIACIVPGATGTTAYAVPGFTLHRDISFPGDGVTTAIIHRGTGTAPGYATDYMHNNGTDNLVGTEPITVTGAFKVVIPEGVTAKIGTNGTEGSALTGTFYVKKSLKVGDITPDGTSDQGVLDVSEGAIFGKTALSGALTVNKDIALGLATKISVTANEKVKIYGTDPVTGADYTLITDPTTNTDCFVVPGKSVTAQATGTSGGEEKVQVTLASGDTDANVVMGADDNSATITVGKKAITVADTKA